MLQEAKLALDSLKVALDIGSFIIRSDTALDKALLKIELEKMIDALVDTKQTVRDLDDTIVEKNKEIELLKERLKNKSRSVGYLGARYLLNVDDEPTGTAHCPTCWADNKELIPLTAWSNAEPTHKCGKCRTTVINRMSPLNVDQYIKSNREASETMKMSFSIETYE